MTDPWCGGYTSCTDAYIATSSDLEFAGVILGRCEVTQRPIPSEKEEAMRKGTKVVALDIHAHSSTVAIAEAGRRDPRLYGDIASTGEALSKLV